MIQLNQHFTFKKIITFTIPSIIMMIFISFYSVVDGLFLSNFVGKTAFSAVNFVIPYLLMLGGIGFMFGSGGSALIAKRLGEGQTQKANQIFTSLTIVSLLIGIIFAIGGIFTIRPLSILLGARWELLDNCVLYGKIYLIAMPLNIIQFEFQNLFITAKKPRIGLVSTLISGFLNIILDALFIIGFSWNLVGAAVATVISMCVGGIIPIIYFLCKNSSLLHFVKTKICFHELLLIFYNGASEFFNNISMNIVSMIYNAQLIKYAGENGIAIYGILMYINFLFISIFIGYTIGISPIISYNYGAKNNNEIKSLLIKSCIIVGILSIIMFILAESLAKPISLLFVGYDENLFNLTLKAFLLFSFCFLFTGMGIFSSSFFTALNNGLISAIISIMRTFVLQILFVFILPIFMGINGIWISVVLSELLTAILGITFIIINKKKYEY